MDSATQAIAYADDLLSVSSTITSLQQQADLVAAFAAIFELDLAHTKFRAYEFPYHRTHARQPSTPPLVLKVNGTDIPFDKRERLCTLAANMTWTQKGSHNLNTTNSNLIDTYMPYVTDQPPSTAKSTSYKVPSSLGSRTPANLSPLRLSN
jgi:hypothetical protein